MAVVAAQLSSAEHRMRPQELLAVLDETVLSLHSWAPGTATGSGPVLELSVDSSLQVVEDASAVPLILHSHVTVKGALQLSVLGKPRPGIAVSLHFFDAKRLTSWYYELEALCGRRRLEVDINDDRLMRLFKYDV